MDVDSRDLPQAMSRENCLVFQLSKIPLKGRRKSSKPLTSQLRLPTKHWQSTRISPRSKNFFFNHTFQLEIGTNSANRNTPTSGPVVAELISIAVSMTPDRKPTVNAIPMIKNEYSTPITLMPFNCVRSLTARNCGNCETKSSHVTIASELMFDTLTLYGPKPTTICSRVLSLLRIK